MTCDRPVVRRRRFFLGIVEQILVEPVHDGFIVRVIPVTEGLPFINVTLVGEPKEVPEFMEDGVAGIFFAFPVFSCDVKSVSSIVGKSDMSVFLVVEFDVEVGTNLEVVFSFF